MERSAVPAQVIDIGLIGLLGWPHTGDIREFVAFPEIAAGTRGDDVFPSGHAAL